MPGGVDEKWESGSFEEEIRGQTWTALALAISFLANAVELATDLTACQTGQLMKLFLREEAYSS